jgi:hypothetical protein
MILLLSNRSSLASKAWNIHEDAGTFDNYSRTLAKFTQAALKSLKASKEAYKLPLCQDSLAFGLALLDELEVPSPKKVSEAKIAALHPFLWKLFSVRPAALRTRKWDDPIQAYLPLQFLLRDGNFSSPKTVTPELAHWKYLIRSSAILEAWNTKDFFQGDLIA